MLLTNLLKSYSASTPQSLKILDAYMLFMMLTGITQFAYVLLVGTYPYNAFLAGFVSCVGAFCLAGTCPSCSPCAICSICFVGLRREALGVFVVLNGIDGDVVGAMDSDGQRGTAGIGLRIPVFQAREESLPCRTCTVARA